MKALAELFAISTIAVMVSMLFGGCSSLNKASAAIDAVSVIESAAAGASGDYAKALAAISKVVQRTKSENGADPLEGYSFSRTYFVDNVQIDNPARITWVDKWSKSGSAGKGEVPQPSEGITGNDALVDEIADALIKAGVAE